MSRPNRLYFIDAGPRPEWHKAPYHRFRLCTDRRRAYYEAGDTADGRTIWQRPVSNDGCGWLLLRWLGLDIDYGPLVRGGDLPGGGKMGFAHPPDKMPWPVLGEAVWISKHEIPRWLSDRGVRLPDDEFTLAQSDRVLDWYRAPPLLDWAAPKCEAIQLALSVLAHYEDQATVGALKDKVMEVGLFG